MESCPRNQRPDPWDFDWHGAFQGYPGTDAGFSGGFGGDCIERSPIIASV